MKFNITMYSVDIFNSTLCNGFKEDSIRSPEDLKQYDQIDTILLSIIMPCILVVGCACNAAFVYVVISVSWMQTIPNKYLCNLAIADIILLVSAIGEKITRYWMSPHVYDEAVLGYFGCIVIPVCKFTSYYASILFVTLVTVERYIAVCRPLEMFSNNTNKKSSQVIAISWIISAFLACTQIPSTCNKTTYCIMWSFEELQNTPSLPDHIGYCLPVGELQWLEDFAIIVQAIPFLIAMICNVILYVKIIRELDKRMVSTGISTTGGAVSRQLSVQSNDSDQNPRNVHLRDRVARMLIINGTVFFLLTSPFQVIMLVKAVTNKDPLEVEKQLGTWLQVCRVLTYVNSLINPIIYGVTNSKYRKAFRRAFRCFKRTTNHTSIEIIRPSLRAE